jgi:hypothetical protein
MNSILYKIKSLMINKAFIVNKKPKQTLLPFVHHQNPLTYAKTKKMNSLNFIKLWKKNHRINLSK